MGVPPSPPSPAIAGFGGQSSPEERDGEINMNYIFWLIFSGLFFAAGEFLSKKFAISPSVKYVIFILIIYSLGVLAWLPAILQKNQLSVVGTMWSVISLLTIVLIGLILFKERLSIFGYAGTVTALTSIVLLSIK